MILLARQKDLERKEIQRKHKAEIVQKRLKPPLTESRRQQHQQSYNEIHTQDESSVTLQLLELAMDWNSIDIAKELVLKNSLEFILVNSLQFIFILISNPYCFTKF